MEIDYREFKPKVRGVSDFYSWRLYQWMAKKSCPGLEVWEQKDYPLKGATDLWIGHMHEDGFFSGSTLRGITAGRFQVWAVPPSARMKNVTARFWKEYRRIGTCAVHRGKWHRWEESGKRRTCLNCGERQTLISKRVCKTQHIWTKAA